MKILLINQSFNPDVVATGQYLSVVAAELAKRGHEVTVLCSQRGYDDPTLEFAREEEWNGVRIRRVPNLNLGKKSRWRRAVNFASFWLSCFWRLMILPSQDAIVSLTLPPLIPAAAALFTKLKGGRLIVWVMDLNPDEAIAYGWIDSASLAARILGFIGAFPLRQASKVIVLDRFMKERVQRKRVPEEQIEVIPPWPHDDVAFFDPQGRERFRRKYKLGDRYVAMYSGNHSPCHPLSTILEAARRMASNPSIVFCFVGGGSEFRKIPQFVKQHGLENIICVPYQPFSQLSASLSAADLHLVTMGNQFAGIVHPCKIYNILSVGLDFLYLGPPESHITDLLKSSEIGNIGHSVRHGDVDAVVRILEKGVSARRKENNRPIRSVVPSGLTQAELVSKVIDLIEATEERTEGDWRSVPGEVRMSVRGKG
jgi:glycosyltransferase involved in cell wall biosynthesis